MAGELVADRFTAGKLATEVAAGEIAPTCGTRSKIRGAHTGAGGSKPIDVGAGVRTRRRGLIVGGDAVMGIASRRWLDPACMMLLPADLRRSPMRRPRFGEPIPLGVKVIGLNLAGLEFYSDYGDFAG